MGGWSPDTHRLALVWWPDQASHVSCGVSEAVIKISFSSVIDGSAPASPFPELDLQGLASYHSVPRAHSRHL